LGLVENFREGRWLEQRVGPEQSSGGKIIVQASNEQVGSNAVISIIEWVADK